MFRSVIFSFVVLVLTVACADETLEVHDPAVDCSTPATVKDLSGLDGCGFVFELEDGTQLIPIIAIPCFTPPIPQDIPPNPMIDYEFVDGRKVLINYTLSPNYYGICMAGEYASITCVKDAPQTQTDL